MFYGGIVFVACHATKMVVRFLLHVLWWHSFVPCFLVVWFLMHVLGLHCFVLCFLVAWVLLHIFGRMDFAACFMSEIFFKACLMVA